VPLVVYDTRTGVNQEKYILTRVDPLGNKARVLVRRSA